ncbi:MAG: carbohydrate-binding protein [Prevotellaceae bacterium]|jgi:hypothetical protein|nr:carbohydrate-binding protein [Prevotellaceae bacterium]
MKNLLKPLCIFAVLAFVSCKTTIPEPKTTLNFETEDNISVVVNTNFTHVIVVSVEKPDGATVISCEGALPAGVTFIDKGEEVAVISGRTAETGDFPLILKAVNNKVEKIQNFTLKITPLPTVITFISSNSAIAAMDYEFSFTVRTSVQNGVGNTTLSCESSLPAGVTFVDNGNTTATLSGTIAEQNTFPLVFKAMNNGVEAMQNFTLISKEIPPPTAYYQTYSGTPWVNEQHNPNGAQEIPGKVMLAFFDVGGEEITWHDNDNAHTGGFRTESNVDTKLTNASDGDRPTTVQPNPPTVSVGMPYLGWTNTGEWVCLTVDVYQTGTYEVYLFYSENGNNGTVSVAFDGQSVLTSPPLPTTSYYHQWYEYKIGEVSLNRGRQVLKFTETNVQGNNYASLRFVLK